MAIIKTRWGCCNHRYHRFGLYIALASLAHFMGFLLELSENYLRTEAAAVTSPSNIGWQSRINYDSFIMSAQDNASSSSSQRSFFSSFCPVAVVLDAGSTGTRAHVFRYRPEPDVVVCGGKGRVVALVPDNNLKVRPGIALAAASSLSDSLTPYLDPLLVFIRKQLLKYCVHNDLEYKNIKIEVDRHMTTTPVLFRGTAGMRNLSLQSQRHLLRRVGEALQQWGMWYNERWSLGVIEGQQEGVFGWITLNQLMNTFVTDCQKNQRNGECEQLRMIMFDDTIIYQTDQQLTQTDKELVGMVEMGGASAQVVLPSIYKDDAVTVKLCGRDYRLFAKSYHGYGRQLSFLTYLENLLEDDFTDAAGRCMLPWGGGLSKNVRTSCPIPHVEDLAHFKVACLPPNVAIPLTSLQSEEGAVDESLTTGRYSGQQDLSLQGDGSFEICRKAITDLIGKLNPISFTTQTSIVATENFFYFNEYVAMAKGSLKFTAASFQKHAMELCALEAEQVATRIHPDAAKEKSETACFGLIFMSQFLTQVLQVDENKTLQARIQVNGVDVAWPLGLLLQELPQLLPPPPVPSSIKL